MPRNDQMIRQLHLLRELESLRGKTLRELASALPKDYARHERTVRRDLEALEAAGFPLITETINGQTRWRFIDGYRNTLAFGFSLSEVIALRLTRHLLAPLEGTGIQEPLQSALAKAEAGIPTLEDHTPRQLPAIFSFNVGSHKSYASHKATIATLTKATAKLHTVQMRYFSAFNPANRFDPGNPVNPANRYAPNNPFNPANQYDPQNPLDPANRYNPATPFAPLNHGPGHMRQQSGEQGWR